MVLPLIGFELWFNVNKIHNEILMNLAPELLHKKKAKKEKASKAVAGK